MTYDPARPRYALPFAGKEYELLGTFGLIEAVEHAAKANVGTVAVQLVNGMPNHELAKVLSAALTACGHALTPDEVGAKLFTHVGLTGDDNDALRLHLFAFLSICLAPPHKREKAAADAGELLAGLASGPSTGASASASSTGAPPTSSPPTPGA